jgi:outer membrane receptor protein involved in Fe transport
MSTYSVRNSGSKYAFVAYVSLCAALGFAQTTTTPAPTSDTDVKLEKLVVTGSNIPSTLTAGEAEALPVVIIDRKEIDATGYQTAADLLQKMTTSNGGAVPISNNATGFTPAAASISLHGLGPEATLVLINGHRVADYPIGAGGQTAFVDLNSIPLSAVERIEVLTSGASAIYGADAVAGVVNIIFRKNFDGAEASFRYANTTNKDSHELVSSFVQGAMSDTGSITAGVDYYSRAAIFNKDRSYSAIPPYLSTNAIPINAQITTAAYDQALGLPAGTRPPGVTRDVFYADPGVFPGAAGGNSVPADGNIVAGSTNTGNTPASQYIYSNGRQSVWNFNQTSGAYPAFSHYGAFVNGERKLFGTDNIKAYFDMNYQHNFSESQLAPLATGTFTTPGSVEYVIPANTPNPLPTPDGRARAAAAGAYNPFNPFNVDITGGTKFRLFEFGNRILKTDSDAFMATAGIKMDNILDSWNVDMGARYSTIGVHQDFKLVSTSRFNQIVNAADPIFNPASSTYIGTTTPYNPFGYSPDNPIATNALTVNYATVHVKDQFSSFLRNPFITISSGDVAKLPGGDVGVALGVDYRIETLEQNPDAISLLGDDGSGQENFVNKSRGVLAFFAEARVPIVSSNQHITGIYDLSAQLEARDERFVTSNQSKLVPGFALRYQPIDDTLTLRAGFGKGIRQPSLFELYGGTVNGLTSLVDPRTGNSLPETPTQTGSNTLLRPEETKSYTAGIVWSPKKFGLQGFTANADWWRVERVGTVLSNPQNVLDRKFGASPGGLQPGETVTLDGAGTILGVTAPYINAGQTIAQGVDLAASYLLNTASIGRFDFGIGGTYMYSYKQSFVLGQPLQELIGTDASGGQGLDGYVKWKSKFDVNWNYKNFGALVVTNYTGGFLDYDADGNPFTVAAMITFDVQLNYTFHKGFTKYLEGTKLTIGALNVLDRNPPFSSGSGSNASGYPGFLYDSTGRFLYVQLSKKF